MNVAERMRGAPPRSWLFVPALRAPEWIPKAVASGADAIIIDLEDATAPAEKDRARDVVRSLGLVGRDRPAVFIRVNADTAERFEEDLRAAVESGAHGVMTPKTQEAEQIRRAADVLAASERQRGRQPLAILTMAETARGVLNAFAIASASERVCGVALGALDLSADIGVPYAPDAAYAVTAKGLVVLAAVAAGVGAVDSPWFDIRDQEGARREAHQAAALGYVGKLVIHPGHVAPVQTAFTPSEEEVATARGLIDAFERAIAEGSGIAVYEGRMIDRPAVVAAGRVLARAELAGKRSV